MRRMVRLLVATGAVASNLALAASAAAPVTPSYQGVEQKIQAIRQAWTKPGASAQPNRPGWDALFDALLADLRDYGKAEQPNDRLAALDPIYQISEALGTVAWRPAAEVREEVREWLRPRIRLAWAVRRLAETVLALPATSDPTVSANRTRWVDFVRTDLGTALREYDSAPTVAKRQSALRKIQESLGTLSAGNRAQALVALGGARGGCERPVQPAECRHRGRRDHRLAALQRGAGPERAGHAQGLCLAGDRGAEDRFRADDERRRDRLLQQTAASPA